MDPDGVSDASQAIVSRVVAVLKEDQAPVEDEATERRPPMSRGRGAVDRTTRVDTPGPEIGRDKLTCSTSGRPRFVARLTAITAGRGSRAGRVVGSVVPCPRTFEDRVFALDGVSLPHHRFGGFPAHMRLRG